MYVPLSNLCIDSTSRTDRGPAPEFVYNTTNVGKFATGKDKVGRIDAISVETGRTLWSWETRVSNYSPILATGSGLLFNGSMDRYLRALDADRGQVLWQTRLPSRYAGPESGARYPHAHRCGRNGHNPPVTSGSSLI